MKVILFGATGMIGQGALRACLADASVERVLSISRSPGGVTDAKLREVIHRDFNDYTAIAAELAGYDACLFCLGVSAAGMDEAAYSRITYDVTLAAARADIAACRSWTARTCAPVSPETPTRSNVADAATAKARAFWP